MNKNGYLLDTTYACGLIIEFNGEIIETAPIYKWMRGKGIKEVINYLKSKKQFNQIIKLTTR